MEGSNQYPSPSDLHLLKTIKVVDDDLMNRVLNLKLDFKKFFNMFNEY